MPRVLSLQVTCVATPNAKVPHPMAKKSRKDKSSGSLPFNYGVPPEVLAVARSDIIDFRNVSQFCRRQAQNAALFPSIVETKPGLFALRSPFRENFIGSLHCWAWLNAKFSPEEVVANALLRHARWYLSIRDIDAIREKAGSSKIQPRSLRGGRSWIEGLVKATGEFTCDPEADGKPANLFWQESADDPPNFAIEICGPGVALGGGIFRGTLLQSMVNCLAIELKLKRPNAGRPHLAEKAEKAAYHRDHLRMGKAHLAKIFCSCGCSQHTQKCFDRLNKLADSFYRIQRSDFAKLVREQTRKYPAIFS
jgi:hypothetical protein